jgi:hypothetical protein
VSIDQSTQQPMLAADGGLHQDLGLRFDELFARLSRLRREEGVVWTMLRYQHSQLQTIFT